MSRKKSTAVAGPIAAPITTTPAVFLPADIITPQQLADRLQVKVGWVYEKMRPRQPHPLPHFKMGRYLRFSWPAVSAWLQSLERGTPVVSPAKVSQRKREGRAA